MELSNSKSLFERAKKFIPGGVNSPVRAFKSVGGHPVFIKSAKGAYLEDVDGNYYIDLINSWGPMILGHGLEMIKEAVYEAVNHSPSFGAPTEREVLMAELITNMVPSIEKVRMVNSGTEATMAAIRVARGYTKREKIIKFEGCYHGHGDAFLIAAGSGAITLGEPDSPGVTQGVANDTLTAPFNDIEAVGNLIKANDEKIAAIIVEPVVGNMGCVIPQKGFLEGLRLLCDQHKIVLIFDEVMTGFRLSKGGAQEILGIKPDLTTLGKIIGGGLPVGAYGGRKEIMDMVSPQGPVYQAGTLSGNPVAMAAGLAMLNYLNSHPEVYTQIEKSTKTITEGFLQNQKELGIDLSINRIGSMFTLFFTNKEVNNFTDAKSSDMTKFGQYFHQMLSQGVYLAPSQYESLFVSTKIEQNEIEKIISAHKKSLEMIFK